MSSADVHAPLFDAIELVSPGSLIPTCIPTGPDGTADLTPQWLSIRYGFDADSLWLETDVVDPETRNVLYSLYVQPVMLDNNARVWKLKPGRYRVFGLSESMNASTVLLTPRNSSTLCTEAPLLSRVKIEPGLRVSIDLSDSSDDEGRPSHPSIRSSAKRPSPSSSQDSRRTTPFLIPSQTRKLISILPSLRSLGSMPGSKSVLKKLNYDSIRTENVDFLPPSFNGDVIFILPPTLPSAVQKNAKSMEGMDKRYDGHMWTKTMTTNISNTLGLSFRSSNCVGHLQCHNPKCGFLQRPERASGVNEVEFEGSSKDAFPVAYAPPPTSTIVCKICKEPPVCVASCDAKIFYVFGDDTQERACVHVGNHKHHVKVGDYRGTRKIIDDLIEQHVERNPQATISKIVLETSKDVLGNVLLREEDDPHTLLSLEQLEPIFQCCKELNSPNLKNRVYTFKYLRRYGVLDGITKLRGLSNWAYVQRNMFPGQGDDSDKVFIFKMSEVGPGSGVDLVRRMQPSGDLEHSWMMFDHVKRVANWTTMACHVYDASYQRVLTIACCDFQSEDKDAQLVFWKNLNHVMGRHGIHKPQFQGFMADSAQANWNAVRIIYGSGDPKIPMEGRERTCYFHWAQSLEKHTKQYIVHELQDQHKKLCMQYKDARSVTEAETRYLAIKAW